MFPEADLTMPTSESVTAEMDTSTCELSNNYKSNEEMIEILDCTRVIYQNISCPVQQFFLPQGSMP